MRKEARFLSLHALPDIRAQNRSLAFLGLLSGDGLVEGLAGSRQVALPALEIGRLYDRLRQAGCQAVQQAVGALGGLDVP